MTEASPTEQGTNRRKRLLAAVLLLTMFALMGRVVYVLWKEGDEICQALQGELERVPSAQMPCSRTSFVVGPIDAAMVEATGADIKRWKTRYRFGDRGDVVRIENDVGDDGSADVTYDCSALGKILMPLTNYAAWSSYGTFQELARGGASPVERVTDDLSEGVHGLRTRLNILGDPALPRTLTVKASTHDEDERLYRQVVQGLTPGRLTVSEYEYDLADNLRSKRQMIINHPYTVSRQTDFTYECWE